MFKPRQWGDTMLHCPTHHSTLHFLFHTASRDNGEPSLLVFLSQFHWLSRDTSLLNPVHEASQCQVNLGSAPLCAEGSIKWCNVSITLSPTPVSHQQNITLMSPGHGVMMTLHIFVCGIIIFALCSQSICPRDFLPSLNSQSKQLNADSIPF
jgi:hypothetical protein